MGKTLACPLCGHETPDPDHMEAAELRTIRSLIGWRSGWRGELPRGRFAYLLKISERSLFSYEKGSSAIPRLVSMRARELRETPTKKMPLPTHWEERRQSVAGKRERAEKRARRKDARFAVNHEPPFAHSIDDPPKS